MSQEARQKRALGVDVEKAAACGIGQDRERATVMLPTTSAVNACLLQRSYYAVIIDLQLGLAFLPKVTRSWEMNVPLKANADMREARLH
jgi:hypothetical protein